MNIQEQIDEWKEDFHSKNKDNFVHTTSVIKEAQRLELFERLNAVYEAAKTIPSYVFLDRRIAGMSNLEEAIDAVDKLQEEGE